MAEFYILIAIVSFLDLLAEYMGKNWALAGRPVYLWATCALFAVAGYFFAHSLKFHGVAIANILWIALTAILITLMGYFVFKEHLSMTNIVGMVVILIGVILVNLK